jgi:hypothetical protein
MPPPTKRRKLENNDKQDVEMKDTEDFGPDRSSDEDEWVSEDEGLSVASSSLDTDTEIAPCQGCQKIEEDGQTKTTSDVAFTIRANTRGSSQHFRSS